MVPIPAGELRDKRDEIINLFFEGIFFTLVAKYKKLLYYIRIIAKKQIFLTKSKKLYATQTFNSIKEGDA
ncbi:hypothetical protein CSC2_17670 [Clostridium zeae]|uniref:Uncharacterized protein n=1 Tax=Clostridium zeae TaxID=2759022 RepID=A0ABQ1E928_9CLOT|nr:hypothetical protein CSC2_17670 [Clostridium zeae]